MRSRKRLWAIITLVSVSVALLVYFLIQDSKSSVELDSQRSDSAGEGSVGVDVQVPENVRQIFKDRIAARSVARSGGTSTNTLDELRNDTGLDDASLTRYLIAYEVGLADYASAMMAHFMRLEIVPAMNKGDVILGALPLYASDDVETRQAAYESLALASMRDGQISFDPFESVLSQVQESETHLLARFMYGQSPDQAIQTLADVFENNARKRSQIQNLVPEFSASLQDVPKYRSAVDAPNVTSELVRFAEDDRWWVRMYAASTLKDYWGLRDRELVDRLRNDPNAQVRGFLEGLNPSQLYKQEPLPGREAGAEAIRLRTERLRELQRQGALDDVLDP